MKRVDIVCYTSKLCNLRCRYCYELPLLSDRARMSFEQIERLFNNIELGYHGSDEPVAINFHWHGGEPLLIPPQFYWRIFEIQRLAFARSVHKVTNRIQSNFTVMDDDRVALLREFDSVGVSLDLFSGLRVNKGGVCQESRALKNLERVRAAGIAVGGVTVLSQPNLPHISDIYRFYRDRRMCFRVRPLEKGLYPGGQDFEIGPRDVLQAYCTLADMWLTDDSPVSITPLDRFLFLAIHANQHPDNRVALYNPGNWASMVLVDTDGSVYTYGERFQHSLGNLFTTPLDQVLAGPLYQDSTEATRVRMATTCRQCPYYGRACPGDPIGESYHDFVEYEDDGSLRCIVARGIIRHIEQRLREMGTIAASTTHDEEKVLAGRIGFGGPR